MFSEFDLPSIMIHILIPVTLSSVLNMHLTN